MLQAVAVISGHAPAPSEISLPGPISRGRLRHRGGAAYHLLLLLLLSGDHRSLTCAQRWLSADALA